MTIMETMRGRRKRAIAEPEHPYNVNELERDVEDALERVRPRDLDQDALQQLALYIPAREEPVAPTPLPMVTLPPYVEHNLNVDDLGKLSSAAVVQQYEAAAVTLEAMGKELIDAAQRGEKMAAEVKVTIKEVEEVAQKYRDEAKRVFLSIERSSLLTAEVRATCNEMRKKIEDQT